MQGEKAVDGWPIPPIPAQLADVAIRLNNLTAVAEAKLVDASELLQLDDDSLTEDAYTGVLSGFTDTMAAHIASYCPPAFDVRYVPRR